jgi:hypothetical protein
MPEPFISRDDLADHLHLPAGALDEDEAALQAVDAACDDLRDRTGQLFNHVADETILMDGTGTDALLLPQLPVEEVSSVVVQGYESAEGYAFALHDSGVLLRIWEPTGTVVASEARWPKGRNNVELTYTHGYADADFPRSIRMLAVRMAARFYQQAPGVVFESLGQHSVRYDTDAGALSSAEALIVRKHTYKRQPSYVVVA